MSRHRLFFAVLVVPFLFYSCNRLEEQGQECTPLNEHVFSVSAFLPEIEQEPDTKGYLGSFISASWNKDDKVSVVNLTTGKILGGSLTADRAGIKATFNGTVTGSISAGDVISLLYPSFETTEETDFGTRNVSIAEQSQDSKVPLVAYSTFTADNTDGTFADISLDFYYIISFLKINLANLPAGAALSKIQIRNIPNELSLSVNEAGDGFDAATDEEKSAMETINVSGSFTTSASGTLGFSVGVMPSSASASRSILVTTEDGDDYLSSMASGQLASHKYYNTIASKFEIVGFSNNDEYGIYDLSSSSVVDSYDEFASNVITGVEDNESDFTLLNLSTFGYWTLKGLPADVAEGATFTARILSNGIDFSTNAVFENAKVCMIEDDGDFSKIRVKAGNNLFIIRK